jgi:hypothetical protein
MPLDIQPQPGGPPTCPQCGANQFQPATGAPPPGMTANPQGQVGVEYPKGRFLTEVENVFTCFFDNSSGPSIYDSPYFLTVRHRNKDWITRMYG